MKQLLALIIVWFTVLPTPTLMAQSIIKREDLATIFNDNKAVGTFVLYNTITDQLTLVNPERAKIQKIPASTFKIPNSIIALETGVIADEHEIIPYGDKPQFLKRWERDMALSNAFRVSNVPVYQELARRVGLQNYQKWLAELNYGNQQTGKNVERFWLDGPLKISAVEQAMFLARLVDGKLPITPLTQQTLSEISFLETRNGKSLHGKTGWTVAPDPDIGWFVGWVKGDAGYHTFALNMDMRSRNDNRKRKAIALELLRVLGVY